MLVTTATARVLQKGAVALIGLDDHDVAIAKVAARVGPGEAPPITKGRIEAGARQNLGDHRCGCCLAVSSRDCDATAAKHQRT